VDCPEDRAAFAEGIASFPEALRDRLRGGTVHPSLIARDLGVRASHLARSGRLNLEEFRQFEECLRTCIDVQGACERILKTPIPYSYSMFMKKFIFMYIVTLPLGFVGTFAWWTVAVVMAVFYVLVSVELIAEEIENPFGTDDQARDVAARVIYGFRVSVLFGFTLTIISSVIGIAAGAVQGYFGGWTDLIFQRFIEIWTSLPSLYLLIIISSVIAPSFFVLLGILLLFSWVALVSVVRAEFLRARNLEYVKAARALGLSNAKIMWKHVLPNAMVATLTLMPFILNGSITTLTSLDFLGFGLPPGSPSLGEMLQQGKSNLQAPWLGLTAFAVIALMLSLLIFIGEALRDAFDPRKTFA
jgi:ABC-type dipeptide/oligopeptide/nickel transport system permease subunit